MVFQDAKWYLDLDLEVRAPVVLHNLIHKGEMPPTVVVFVEASENRNAEYDAFSDDYAPPRWRPLPRRTPLALARLSSGVIPELSPSRESRFSSRPR